MLLKRHICQLAAFLVLTQVSLCPQLSGTAAIGHSASSEKAYAHEWAALFILEETERDESDNEGLGNDLRSITHNHQSIGCLNQNALSAHSLRLLSLYTNLPPPLKV